MILEHKHEEEEGVIGMLEIKLSSKLNRVWWDQRKGIMENRIWPRSPNEPVLCFWLLRCVMYTTWVCFV